MAQLLVPFAGDDAPQLALALRRNFGSLGRALRASPAQMEALGPALCRFGRTLVAARELVEAAQREALVSSKVDPADPALAEWLQARLCSNVRERLLVLFCDARGYYLADEESGWGDARSVRLDLAQLYRRALALDAAGLVLAHNHPSGECRPSEEDIVATRRIAETGRELGIALVDHLIVTRTAIYSMREGGRI